MRNCRLNFFNVRFSILLLTSLSGHWSLAQEPDSSRAIVEITSQDRKFSAYVYASEEGDAQTRYSIRLHDHVADRLWEMANCVRHDLGTPHIYLTQDSRFMIYEACSESWSEGRIKIHDPDSYQARIVLTGLFGNGYGKGQQFDWLNEVIIYFDTTKTLPGEVPPLCIYELNSRYQATIYKFDMKMDVEFPEIKWIEGKREVHVRYVEPVTGRRIEKLLEY